MFSSFCIYSSFCMSSSFFWSSLSTDYGTTIGTFTILVSWFIFTFIGAVSYWLWVQKDDQKRVDDEVSRRKEAWQREEDERAREREAEKRRKYVEMVQRRIDKSDWVFTSVHVNKWNVKAWRARHARVTHERARGACVFSRWPWSSSRFSPCFSIHGAASSSTTTRIWSRISMAVRSNRLVRHV